MTWIPCSMCHQVRCICTRPNYGTPVVFPQTQYTFTPRLSDEDIERIAKRLKQLLKEDL